MKKILILGHSAACITFIEEFRKSDKESEITLFSFEDNLPYYRHLFGDFLAKNVTEDEIFCRATDFFTRHSVNFITGKNLLRIDFKRNRLVCENREYISYDILVLNRPPLMKLPDIKGNNKEGVFSLQSLDDVKAILKLLPIIETVVVQSEGIGGLKAAYGLLQRQKEVIVLTGGAQILPRMLDRETATFVEEQIVGQGVRVIKDNRISQILGDGDVKAIRVQSGKVFACQLVVMQDDGPDMRLFQDGPLELHNGIVVNESHRTHLDNVFALDRLCSGAASPEDMDDFELSACGLEVQGQRVAAVISGGSFETTGAVREVPVSLFNMNLVILGQIENSDTENGQVYLNMRRPAYMKLFYRKGSLIGAVLINADPLKDCVRGWIAESSLLKGKEPDMLESQAAFRQIFTDSQVSAEESVSMPGHENTSSENDNGSSQT